MQYIFLKNIIESILANFICPQCQSKTNEQSIQIIGVSSHGMDIHIHCHSCGAKSQLNAEINTMASQMLTSEHGRKFFEDFIKNGGTIDTTMINKNTNSNGIKPEDIAKIDSNIQKAKTVEDLMNGDQS